MKKIAVLAFVAMLLVSGSVYALDHNGDTSQDDILFKLSGAGSCQLNGSYIVTWTIDNTGNASGMAYDGNTVAANSIATYQQTVDGTKTGPVTATVTGHWEGTDSEDDDTETATVNLSSPCAQPVVPNSQPVTPVVTVPVPGFSGK